jgi:hypothetical protein
VGRGHLQRLAVPHDALARHGVLRPGEALPGGLAADDHRQGEDVAHEILVDVVQDAAGVLPCVGFRCVRGMAFLPQKLRGAQENSRSQLPSDDIGPLIEKQREVAVAVDPFGHVFTDDCLACRTDGKRLSQFLAASMRHHGELGAESFDMLGLAFEEVHRNQQWEVGVLRACGLDASIDLGLHPLPDRVAGRPNHHGPARRAVLRQLRLGQHILVPPRKVLVLRS